RRWSARRRPSPAMFRNEESRGIGKTAAQPGAGTIGKAAAVCKAEKGDAHHASREPRDSRDSRDSHDSHELPAGGPAERGTACCSTGTSPAPRAPHRPRSVSCDIAGSDKSRGRTWQTPSTLYRHLAAATVGANLVFALMHLAKRTMRTKTSFAPTLPTAVAAAFPDCGAKAPVRAPRHPSPPAPAAAPVADRQPSSAGRS